MHKNAIRAAISKKFPQYKISKITAHKWGIYSARVVKSRKYKDLIGTLMIETEVTNEGKWKAIIPDKVEWIY